MWIIDNLSENYQNQYNFASFNKSWAKKQVVNQDKVIAFDIGSDIF